jgi:plastocyanin
VIELRTRERPASIFLRGAGLLSLALLLPWVLSCSRHPSGEGETAAATGPVRHHVTLHGVRFDPESLEVAVGDTVEWDNRDLVPHSSTALDSTWLSPALLPDSSWSTVIRAAGAHAYRCLYHPTMKAQLIARGG